MTRRKFSILFCSLKTNSPRKPPFYTTHRDTMISEQQVSRSLQNYCKKTHPPSETGGWGEGGIPLFVSRKPAVHSSCLVFYTLFPSASPVRTCVANHVLRAQTEWKVVARLARRFRGSLFSPLPPA